jgi:hypothetical protein
LVAVKLADHADDDGGSIFPAVGTVSKMTSLSRSTVCKWQFAFEHCGLLKVVDRSGGGKGNTTERAFDVDLLTRIVWTKKERNWIPPACKLVEATRQHQVINKKTGKPKTVVVTVFEVVPFADPAAQTVRQTDGSCNDNRPPHGRATVRQTDSNRPPHGHESSFNPQEEPSPPLPPNGGEHDLLSSAPSPTAEGQNAEKIEGQQGADAPRGRRRPPPRTEGREEGPTGAEVEAGFAEWWAAYPSKVDRIAAKRAYERVVSGKHKDPECRATIPQLLSALKTHRFPDDAQFVKHPATWLNKGAWCEAVARGADQIGGEIEEMLAKPNWKYLVHELGPDGARRRLRELLEQGRGEQHATAA